MSNAPTDVGQLAVNVDRFVRRLHASLHGRAQQVDAEKIGPFGGMVLMCVSELQPISMHALTAHLARDKSQMTRVVASLEHKGLVERRRSETDGRVTVIALTEAGSAQVGAFERVLTDVVEDLLDGWSPDEVTAFARLIAKI